MVCAMLIQSATACNICGSAAGGSYLGVLPQYQKNFIGLRYQYRSFESTHPYSIIPGLSGRKSMERFQSADITGRYCPGKRWQILGFIQYQYLEQRIEGRTFTLSGPGDPMLLAYYSVLPGKRKVAGKWQQLLQAGAGIKAPLGRYRGMTESSEYNPAFQAGTGSWDGLLSLIYTLRSDQTGLVLDATGAFNGENSMKYRFGHRINATARAFYTAKYAGSTWMGSAGLYGEHALEDRLMGLRQEHTGGTLLMPVMGLDRFTENWAMGINLRIPAWQNLAEGYIKSHSRWLLNVAYLF